MWFVWWEIEGVFREDVLVISIGHVVYYWVEVKSAPVYYGIPLPC